MQSTAHNTALVLFAVKPALGGNGVVSGQLLFDFLKMCPKCHILVFYRFRTLSGPQMADFRLYMTFATTSGQDLKNPKKMKKWIF